MTRASVKLVRGIAQLKRYAFEVRETEGCGRLRLVHLTEIHYRDTVYAQDGAFWNILWRRSLKEKKTTE